ncbi:hypothetical protein IWQ47_003488 [Aquimarina sp. EL_43]|uniref:hypothetical protein n=1 Tax=unclassified Aquimarina TaxID=2627091 RepID=UPI0018CBA3F9|nr:MULTISPECIES: hypothetical protein [unclassified Aquimarina]MBG6131770.1 hypothetical protein [Aquimarina sp. EL_35]MBG6149334.1 hypothetical protein [Aquimarina sp. EL_32]MBG6170403.1 hypothetical protein [Aquimarina sp. EL_43]
MKGITLLLITLTSCYSYQEVNKEPDILIAAYKKEGGGIYLINTNKNQTILLDSIKILPSDLKFLNSKHIAYFGDRIIDILSSDKQIKKTSNSFVEAYTSLALTDNTIVLDSLHYSFFTDAQVKNNRYKLLGYTLNLDKKLFSLDIGDKDFKFKKYDDIGDLRYVFYPDVFPKSVSIKKHKIHLKILDLKEQRMTTFDSLPKPRFENKNLIYFDSGSVRVEKDQKISMLSVYSDKNNKRFCVIEEYDYVNNIKSTLKKFFIDKEITDNYKHRIHNNKVFLATDNAIFKIVNNEQKEIYSNEDFKILDFYLE